MHGIVANHNKRVFNKSTSEERSVLSCNCRDRPNCLLDGYKASIDAPDSKAMTFYGCCKADFKARFYKHIQSFKNLSKRNQIELLKLVKNLWDDGHSPAIKWFIACKATAYKCRMKLCELCLSEKLAILLARRDTLLN